ncbi:MAG: hypothetical protein OXN18_14745 [Gemmatimonadota bacterium]|nr:hypothetical protein [Gemmatimonadota bacterium]
MPASRCRRWRWARGRRWTRGRQRRTCGPFSPRFACLLVPLAACADQPEPPAFVAAADSRQLMVSVIEPAAEVYWDAVGVIMDEEGTHEIEPRTPEEWTAVENAAWVLAESGNLLLLEDRAQGRGHWIAMSRSMIEVGRRAVDAAAAKDAQAVFDVGAEVYFVCTGCHAVYAAETLRPNALPGAASGDSAADMPVEGDPNTGDRYRP